MTQEAETLRMMAEMKGELGEVRGQLRELIHHINNIRQAMEGHASTPHRLNELAADVLALEVRLTALEAAEHQRTGALSFTKWIFESPVIGWVTGAAVALWAILYAKIGR